MMIQWLCYRFNALRLFRLSAFVRWLTVKVCRQAVVRGIYSAAAQHTSGYSGWLEVPHLGCLAFEREDGSIQYRW
ncbi:MAG: hypothetical protein K8I30_09535 [Anaerolineae bacterium]|nr:hypothetical protein [Anaerolineae bacterium]